MSAPPPDDGPAPGGSRAPGDHDLLTVASPTTPSAPAPSPAPGIPPAPGTPPSPAGPAATGRRRRVVAWSAGGVFVVFAVLVAFLATVGTVQAHSRLLGGPAPALRGAELGTHRTISLDQYAGKWVLVNFAASWCIPCQEEMPQLLAFARSAPRYDAMVLTVTYDAGDVDDLHHFLLGDRATWPAVADAAADIAWGVSSPPQSFLVNPAGIVSAFFYSGINAVGLDRALAKAEGRPAPAA